MGSAGTTFLNSAVEHAFFFQYNDTKVQCFMSLFIIRTVLYSLDASH